MTILLLLSSPAKQVFRGKHDYNKRKWNIKKKSNEHSRDKNISNKKLRGYNYQIRQCRKKRSVKPEDRVKGWGKK